MEESFQGRAGVGEGLPDDEVLHAVGGDEHRVVAVCVGGEKLIAEDLDVDFAGEQIVVAAGERRLGNGRHIPQWRCENAVDRDAMLSVGDLERVLSFSAVRVCARSRKVILHDVAEAMPGDPPDLAQGRLDLGAAVIAQSLAEPGRDGVLLVSRAQMTNGKPNLAWYFALVSWNQAISSSLRRFGSRPAARCSEFDSRVSVPASGA